jgi:uncharacterized membrane protein
MDGQTPLQRSKQPRTILAGPYGHPFHPILVTIPIGAWTAAIIFDIAALASKTPEPFVEGTIWLIGIGIVGAVVAACFGLMDLATLTKGTQARKTALTHMSINLTVVVLFVVSYLIRVAGDRDQLNIVAFILAIIAILLLGVSGYLGGKLAYHYGIRVAEEATQQEGFR